MSEIVDFLLVRLAEDEAMAHRFSLHTGGARPWALFEGDDPYAMHIDPRRVLAEVEAKRRIVELHRQYLVERLDDEFPGDSCDALCDADSEDFPCLTLRLLALPYADHPDYRQEWRA